MRISQLNLSPSLAKLSQMSKHPFRKFLGLAALYILIIFGIFVIQFKNDSVITNIFGSLRLIVAETYDDNNTPLLKNQFEVSLGGFVFFSDSTSRTTIISANNNTQEKNLVLSSWEQISETGVTLHFEEGVSLTFIAPEDESVLFPITVTASTADTSVRGIRIPYKMNTSYTYSQADSQTLQLFINDQQFILTCSEINPRELLIEPNSDGLVCRQFEEEKIFTLEDTLQFALNDSTTYNNLLMQIRTGIVSKFPQNPQDSPSEKAVAAWIAENAPITSYSQAVADAASFLPANRRTYFTSPYYNNLATQNDSLLMQKENLAYRAEYSVTNTNLEAFELEEMLFYLQTSPLSEIRSILALAANPDVQPANLKQAAGILYIYTSLCKNRPDAAAILQPAAAKCAEVIKNACVADFETETVAVYDGENPASLTLVAKAAEGMRAYGIQTKDSLVTSLGHLILNSALAYETTVSALDYETIAKLYSILVTDNTWYPHPQILAVENDRVIWAWTVARSIDYSVNSENTAIINIDFPLDSPHHMIINGIAPFTTIEMHGLSYHSAPNFESYNSTGYVYQSGNASLLLKCRHRGTNTLTVRLFHK